MNPEKEDNIYIVFHFIDTELQPSVKQYKEDGCISFTTLTVKEGKVVPEYDTDLTSPIRSEMAVPQCIGNWDLLVLFEWAVNLYGGRIRHYTTILETHWHEPDYMAIRAASTVVPPECVFEALSSRIRVCFTYPFFELVAEVSKQTLGVWSHKGGPSPSERIESP